MKIGIDLGGSHVAVGLVTEEGKVIVKQEKNISFVSQEKETMQEKIRDHIVSLINAVLKEIQVPIFLIENIGVGIPGIVENNKIKKCNKFRIKDWDLAQELEKYYGIPVILKNDALCATIAEKEYGALKGIKKAVFLCFGTGIGGVSIIDNQVIPSEYGHMIIQRDGKECNCGQRGCFETYSSMKVFKEEIIKILKLDKNTTSEELLAILRREKENREINDYIDYYIQAISIGIYNIVNIINPKRICIGGSFVYFEDILYKRLLEKALTMQYQFEKPEIVLAELGNTAGIIGATLI